MRSAFAPDRPAVREVPKTKNRYKLQGWAVSTLRAAEALHGCVRPAALTEGAAALSPWARP